MIKREDDRALTVLLCDIFHIQVITADCKPRIHLHLLFITETDPDLRQPLRKYPNSNCNILRGISKKNYMLDINHDVFKKENDEKKKKRSFQSKLSE